MIDAGCHLLHKLREIVDMILGSEEPIFIFL